MRKRLTKRAEYGNAELVALPGVIGTVFPELSDYELYCLAEVLNKLADYEDAEERKNESEAKQNAVD